MWNRLHGRPPRAAEFLWPLRANVMVDFVTKSVNSRMITAFFDTREDAQRGSDSLITLGVKSHQIQITEGASDPNAVETSHAEMGFWESLKSMFLPAEDHHSYAEGLRRGGYLLSANVEPELYDRAVEVVDSTGAVNMDEREGSWRSSGWEGYQPTGMVTGTAIGAAEGMASDPALTTPVPGPAGGGIAGYDRAGVRDTSLSSQRLRGYTIPLDDRSSLAPDVNQPFLGERFSAANDSGRIAEHMDVIASDGEKIGTVDHLEAGAIKLAKSTSPDGEHHFIPLAWIDHVDTHVHLTKTTADARANW
jgi:hypothetical protein